MKCFLKTLALLLLAARMALCAEPVEATSSALKLATGNLSVDMIQHSPIGASPQTTTSAQLPSVKELCGWYKCGLRGYEDYLAWGMVEPQEGRFDFSHHERVAELLAKGGIPYIPYLWCHVPPTWLRNDKRATLMRCNEHNQPCYMLSIFDPRTLDWYEHFYSALNRQMGGRIGETYACILGPYGEGNYPLPYVDWVMKLGHCHEGYWCADPYALPAFQKAMGEKYATTATLNRAWASHYGAFCEIGFPPEIAKGTPGGFDKRPGPERRRWLDFIEWYHGALVEFAGKSAERAVKVFGRERVAIKPGGNSGWMNPLSWGTYCPAYARLAGLLGIAVQSADSRGAYWADRWSSTAYRFYGVEYRTEAAGALEHADFIKRTFTDVSCGASRLFTYELSKHLDDATRTLHLFTGERSRTRLALLAPSTRYRLGGDVLPAVALATSLRDWADYDVLDEQLVEDGALEHADSRGTGAPCFQVLAALDCDIVESSTLTRVLAWVQRGGTLLWVSDKPVEDVEGERRWPMNDDQPIVTLGKGKIVRLAPDAKKVAQALRRHAPQVGALDGRADQVWVSEFKDSLLMLNLSKKRVERTVEWKGARRTIDLPPGEIVPCTVER